MSVVLVVDDDETVREVVVAYLHRAGLPTVEAADGLQAVAAARRHRPRLVVLDVMLPGIDGIEVLRRMRETDPRLPVILLTALTTEEDRVLGLELGADDYVGKPFSVRELVLRVQGVLRRVADPPSGESGPAEPLHDGDLRLDPAGRTAHLAGRPLALTGREFDLLTYLVTHPGVVVSRQQLMREVWGWDFGDDSTVTVHVRRLRNKVEPDPATPTRIVTVWGAGYRWDRRP
ncbi:response regulator transcription factor [Ornithinimicrobium sediminis]|uniref:response regulator transcription factor n=1 Tax=Ornithinimicrobium sediminis TaxID=2904603 RepID=UPI001E35938E|nr:response regulator transcription factor [Ornithinimicrobium sediminis]